METRRVLEVLFLFNQDNKKQIFPPPPPNRRYASGLGVLGVQKNSGRNKDGFRGDLGLEEGGVNEDDDPDI